MADKRFNITFDVNANINPIKGAIGELKGSLGNLKIPDTFKKSIESTVASLEKEITNFESIASKGFSNMGDFNKANRSFEKISDLFNKLGIQVKNLKGIDPNKFLPAETLKKTQSLQQAWLKLKQTIDKGTGNNAAIERQNKILAEQEQKVKDLEASYAKLKQENVSMGSSKGSLANSLKADKAAADELVKKMKELEGIKGGKSSAEYKQLNSELSQLNGTIERTQKQYDNLDAKINKNKASMSGLKTEIDAANDKLNSITEEVKKLTEAASKTPEELTDLRQKLADLKGVNIDEIPDDIDRLGEEISSLNASQLEQIKNSFQGLEGPVEKGAEAVKDFGEKVHESGDEVSYASERTKELENVANQVKQFFSIGNTVQLFKRAIRSAFDTIKELDAVMTQTAVVTDFTVGDMWAQLPEYTKRANELGVSVKGAYEAATLYYQQGLNTNEVIGVSNETLKMAKIAAIDYATATDYMTSALRGFNMEVNEQSAQKVNDIYSQLAAKTAADTEEISIAMSKTAPLAHNAGMEIETTAAFLAQAIETTREAPETIGTAMKTVIARFQELKKDPALIEPVEGEIVDANKIEGALRTIDVALRDTNGQFRDLDDVFLEISQKWNSLDTNTQRYIATIAAGSRQQSRFIAMMANYDRTMELVEMANTSAGASQQQFEKTLDSMQSKLDRLKNAWNEFTMGLANNSIIKAVVDLLTNFLNVINKLSSGISGNNGVLKSLVDIGILMGGLKLGKAAFSGFFGWLQGSADKTGKGIGKKILSGLLGGKELDKKSGILKTLFANNTEAEVRKNVANFMGLNNRKKSLLDGLLNFKYEDTNLSQVLSNLNKKIASFRWDSKTFSGLFKTLKAPASEIGILGKELGKTFLNIFKTALPYALAIGIAVTAIVTAIKAIKANSLKGRIEAAEASTKRAQDAANQAKEAYDNLLEGKSGYNELQNKLDNLTYGTQAWKEALIEANGQVLELLQTFPQLAQYMSSGANGRLEISAEGWDTVLEQQQNAIRRTTNDLLGAQIYRANLENESIYKQLQKTSGIQRKGLLDELIKQYENNAAFFAKDENGNYSQALKELAFEYNVSADKIYEAQNALKDYEVAIQENGTVINSYVDSLIANNGEIANLRPEIAESIRKVYNNSLAKNYNTKIDAEKGKILTGTGYKEGYNGSYIDLLLEEYGIEASGTTKNKLKEIYKYLANITGEEIDNGVMESKEAMAEAIARMRFGDEIESNINELAKLAKSDFSGGIQQVLDVFSGDLGRFESQEIKELKSAFSEGKDITDAAKALNINQRTLEKAIITMGYTMTDASGNIIADFESFRQAFLDGCIDLEEGIQQATNNLVENMSGAGLDNDAISLGLQGLTDLQKVTLSSFSDKIIGLDPDIQRKIYGQVINSIKSSGEATTELLNNIDFSKPIESIIALQEAANSGEKTLKELAETMLDLSQFSTEKAFQDFMMSDEYAEMEDSLKEFVETNGKISSANIKELAKSNNKLNNLLKLETINASGLAKALTAVTEGRIGFEQLNSAMLIALSSTSSLEDKYGELTDFFAGINEGYDSNAPTNQFASYIETLQDLSSKGLTGDNRFINLSNALFGENAWEEAAKQGEAGMNALMSRINEAGTWFANNGTDFWAMVAQDAEHTFEHIQFGIDENGSVIFENLDGSIDDIIADISKAYGMSEEMANALIQSFASYSPEFQLELNFANARKEYETFLSELEKGGITTVTEQQLKLWADALGVTTKEVEDKIKEIDGSIKVVNWFNDEGLALYGEELKQTIIKSLGYGDEQGLETAMGVQYEETRSGHVKKTIDYEVAMKYAAGNQLTQEQLDDLLNTQNITVTGEFGITAESTADYEAQLEAKNSDIADNLSDETKEATSTGVEAGLADASTATYTGKINRATSGGVRAGLSSGFNSYSPPTINVPMNLVARNFYVNGTRVGGGNNNVQNSGGRVPINLPKPMAMTKAQGTDFGGLKHNEIALTGEEGYELAYNENGAFLLGENGPEIAKLEKGTVIYPHELSKKILQGYSRTIFPNHQTGTISSYYNYGSGSGSSNISVNISTNTSNLAGSFDSLASSMKETAEAAKEVTEETEKWENNVDWLYNMTQQVNHQLRVRDKLERQYQRALKTHTATGEQLKQLAQEELISLRKRQQMQKQMIELRKKELHTYMMLNKEMMKYAIIDNWDDMTIHIAWDSINAVTDPEEGKRIEEFISKLESIVSEVYELEDSVEDIEDDIIELKERGRDEYRNLEDRVLDALISEQQEMIDQQEEEVKAIKEAESSLVDAIQKNIDKMRQDRKNEETETSLAEKERRLAYLRQDTTGSNALEIKRLEKELAQEKQDYSDELIDQALKDLKEQNDVAAEQRERQIEIAQSQLEWQQKTGYWVDEATRIVREGIGERGILDENSRLYQLLYNQEGVETMSNASRDWWKDELQNSVAEAFVWLHGEFDELENAILAENNKQYKADYMAEMIQQINSGDYAGFAANETERNEKIDVQGSSYTKTYMTPEYEKGKKDTIDMNHDYQKDINDAMNSGDWYAAFRNAGRRDAKLAKMNNADPSTVTTSFQETFNQWYKRTNNGKTFKKGGLANFTGPAWLDGTKSKPEMVLNAKDTENFIQLKDILSNLRSGLVGGQRQSGDWYFDIDINVDEIANDYDVDRVADRVKQAIYKETTYRNVNAINFLK